MINSDMSNFTVMIKCLTASTGAHRTDDTDHIKAYNYKYLFSHTRCSSGLITHLHLLHPLRSLNFLNPRLYFCQPKSSSIIHKPVIQFNKLYPCVSNHPSLLFKMSSLRAPPSVLLHDGDTSMPIFKYAISLKH